MADMFGITVSLSESRVGYSEFVRIVIKIIIDVF